MTLNVDVTNADFVYLTVRDQSTQPWSLGLLKFAIVRTEQRADIAEPIRRLFRSAGPNAVPCLGAGRQP